MKILIVGDTVGKGGRKACTHILPKLRQTESLDFIIVNGENIAGGSSITDETVRELFDAGADVVTSGDHIFRKPEAADLVERNPRILRPLNYPEGTPGNGMVIVEAKNHAQVAVINLMGRVFLKTIDCPFKSVEKALESLRGKTPVVIVDFHAEATSEKVALGWFLDGRVSAVVGTHTHVQTADETILPHGTAYLTDLGMCGPHRSVIGRKIDQAIRQFVTQMPTRLEVADEDNRLSGAIIDVDPSTGRALSIRRVHEKMNAKS